MRLNNYDQNMPSTIYVSIMISRRIRCSYKIWPIDLRAILLWVIVFSFFVAIGTHANAQPLSSTTGSWASNLDKNFTGYKLYPSGGACTSGDVNGDGALDIVCINRDPNNQNYYGTASTSDSLVPSSVVVLESTKGGNLNYSSVNGTAGSTSQATNIGVCTVADFDGDGRDDLACFQTTYGGTAGPNDGPSQNWPTVWFSGATPFSLKVANSNSSFAMPSEIVNGQGAFFLSPFSSYCVTGHFMSGPGQQILCNQPAPVSINSSGVATWGATNNYYLWKYSATYDPKTGAESVTETRSYWTGPSVPTNSPQADVFTANCWTGDFNGDGLSDVACPDLSGGIRIGLSTGVGFTGTSDWPTGDTYHTDCTTGDFNGDGKTDIICYAGSSTLHVYLSTGSGFQVNPQYTNQNYQSWTFSGMPASQYILGGVSGTRNSTPSIFASVCMVADVNGDGKTDLLCYPNNTSTASTAGQWVYGLSTGSGFQVSDVSSITPPSYENPNDNNTKTTAIPFAATCTLGDYMGMGLVDILCNNSLQDGPLTPYSVGILKRSN